MLTKEEIANRLKLEEGYSPVKYLCKNGYWTIGYGRNLDANPNSDKELNRNDKLNSGITQLEAIILLFSDIEKIKKQIEEKIPYASNLNDDRYYALVDMCFQMGINGVLRFKKMLSALDVGNWGEAKKECLDSKYAKIDTPNRAKRIAECFLTGKYRYF